MERKRRKTRSDCRVGSFEKNTDYHQERFATKMAVIQEVIKKSEQFGQSMKNEKSTESFKYE